MMESVFSFLPSYFSIIFSAKAKISKSVSFFLSRTGPKWCWPIRLQDFKLNISLEQSNEIVYFFTCWYQKLRVDRKILEWCVARNGCGHPGHKVNGWVNGWTELIFHADANSRKLRIIYFNNFWVAVVKNRHGTLISMNGWIQLSFACWYIFKKAKNYFNT